MIGPLVRAMGFCATILVAVLIATAPVQADDCKCTHQGKPVKCPPDLPAGSKSVQFVKGGTQWAKPTGADVFVPMTTFPSCPGPTATQPAPPGASATTPPPSGPGSTPPAISSPPPPSLTPPSKNTQPGGQTLHGATPQTVRPGDLGRAQQERARGLIEGGPPQLLGPVIPGPVVPDLPGQSTERETDETISRLGRLLQQQPSTTPEKPPETPVPSLRGDQPLLARSKPPQTPAVAVPAETSRDPSAPEEGPGDDDDLNQQDTLIGDKVEKTPPPVTVSARRSDDELAELEITKAQAAEMDPVELGPRRNLVKYTITVTNKGPAAAQNVVVADYMMESNQPVDDLKKAGIPIFDAKGVKLAKDATSDNSEGTAQITKDDKGHFVSGNFKLPLLAKGAIWTITYQVEPTSAGTLVNGAAVKCDNLKRGWSKAFTLWIEKKGIAQETGHLSTWRFFKEKGDGFEWSVDAVTTEVRVVEPSKKP